MASMREIKRRKESIASTEQITKAMKLVATVKLQKARNRAESGKPYMRYMRAAMNFILSKAGAQVHPYLQEKEGGKHALVVISSNRGLAGGYNTNLVRMIQHSALQPENTVLYTLGKKGHDALAGRGYTVAADYSDVINAPLYQDAIDLADTLLKAFSAGEITGIDLAYTEFKNTVVHEPTLVRLLPVERNLSKTDENDRVLMNFDPDDDSVLDSIIPQYITSLLFGAMLQSVASENGARMTAMDAATDNAEEMIDELSIAYNRARQGAITQELTEIIAGSRTY